MHHPCLTQEKLRTRDLTRQASLNIGLLTYNQPLQGISTLTAEPQRTFQEVFSKLLKSMLTYWAQIGVVVSLCSAGLGLTSLYAYTYAIGRTDLFMPSTEAKSDLAVWVIIVAIFISIYIFLLFSTSWLFGITVAMFDRTPKLQKHIAAWLTLPVLTGFISFILVSFTLYKSLGTGFPTTVILVMVLLTTWFTLSRPIIRMAIRTNLKRHAKKKPAGFHSNKTLFVFFLILFLIATVVAGISPTLLIAATYLAFEPNTNTYFAALICLLTLAMTLLPVIIFYRSSGDVYNRTFFGVFSALILFCSFIVILPNTMGYIAYRAALGIDVRQKGAERFILTGDLGLQDINTTLWKARAAAPGKIEIQAFQLFSFGDVLLLCPSSLLKLELHQMKQGGCRS